MRDYEATVKALLAKAEATKFEEERALLEEKAYALMIKHSISPEVFKESPEDKVVHEIVELDNPYGNQKKLMFARIAKALNCQVITKDDDKSINIFGYKSDVDRTRFLYSILANQAFYQASKLVIPQGVHGKTFKTSWFLGFTHSVGKRLTAATSTAQSETTGYALVIRDKSLDVTAEVKKAFPRIRMTRASYSSSAGFNAGQQAGSNAKMYDSQGIKGTRAISR